MRNITLISTVHAEKGLCNISKLHQILERAQPEVIFLEIPPSSFERYLKEIDSWNLESKAVSRYLKTRSAVPVPVDVLEVPEDFFVENKSLFQKIEAASPEYRMMIDRHSHDIERYGFAYLNSQYCVDLWSNLYELVDVEIEKIGEEKLLRSYEYWKDVNERREEEMMKNIQKYSEAHEFNAGIFLVGAAHRRSIIAKSEKLSFRNSVTLEWNFEKYEGLI